MYSPFKNNNSTNSYTLPGSQQMQHMTHSSLSDENQLTLELIDGFEDDFVPEERIIDTPNRQFWDSMQQKADYVTSMNNTFEEEKRALQQQRTQNDSYAQSQNSQSAHTQSYTLPSQKEIYKSKRNANPTTYLTAANQRPSVGAPVGLTRLRILSSELNQSDYENIMNLPPLPRMQKIYALTQGKAPALHSDIQRGDGREMKTGSGNQVIEKTLAYIPAPLSHPMNSTIASMRETVTDYVKDAWRRTEPTLKSVAERTDRSVNQIYQKALEIATPAYDMVEDQAKNSYNQTGKLLKKGYRVIDNAADAGGDMLSRVGMQSAGGMLQEGISSASQLGKKFSVRLGNESARRYDQAETTLVQAYNQVGNGIKSLSQDVGGMLSDTYQKTGDATGIAYDAAKLAYNRRDELAPIIHDVLQRGMKLSGKFPVIIAPSISTAILYPARATEELNSMWHKLSNLGGEEFELFKKKFGGDVHELTDEPVAWVAKNKAHFDDAQNLFDAAEDDIDATALAIAEEMNRNSNALNKLLSHIQDSIIEKYGVVLSLGEFVRPDVGPGNINTLSARNIVEKLKNHPKSHTAELQEILNACRSDESLARYIVTDRGAIMIGAAIMVIEGERLKPFVIDVKDRDDLVQQKANHWREGHGRERRMGIAKAEAEQQGRVYVPKHGYEDDGETTRPESGAHRRNLMKIRKALRRHDD